MTKLFVYNVNGTTLEDTEAFGKAWKEAQLLATEAHCEITRQVVDCDTGEIRNEYYTRGCFLNEKFYPKYVKIF